MALQEYLDGLTDPEHLLTHFKHHIAAEVKSPDRLPTVSLQMGTCRKTKDQKFLLQLRPAMQATSAYHEVFLYLDKEAETGGHLGIFLEAQLSVRR